MSSRRRIAERTESNQVESPRAAGHCVTAAAVDQLRDDAKEPAQ
jgi:hypothetical protein